MTDTDKREELVEEAAKEADRRWPSPNTSFYDGLVSGFKLGAVWAMFEQTHAPTFAEALKSLPTPEGCSGIGLPTAEEFKEPSAACKTCSGEDIRCEDCGEAYGW